MGWQAAVEHYGIREYEHPVMKPQRGGSHRKDSHLRLVPPGVAGIAALVSAKPLTALGAAAAAVAVVGGAVTLAPKAIGDGTRSNPKPFMTTAAGPVAGWRDPPATRLYPPVTARTPAATVPGGAPVSSARSAQPLPTVTLLPATPVITSQPTATTASPSPSPADTTPPPQDTPHVYVPHAHTPPVMAAPVIPVPRHSRSHLNPRFPAPASTGFPGAGHPSLDYQGRHRQDPSPGLPQPARDGDGNGKDPGHRGGQGPFH